MPIEIKLMFHNSQVRDAAFRTIKGFLGKLEKVSEDPSLKEGMGK